MTKHLGAHAQPPATRPALLWASVLATCLGGCFNAPLLDSARTLPKGEHRVELIAALPLQPPPRPRSQGGGEFDNPPDPPSEEGETWRAVNGLRAYGLGAHVGTDFGQVDLYALGGMLGAGGKFGLLDAGPWSVSLGGRIYADVLTAFIDEDALALALCAPLWGGFEPAPWFALYLAGQAQARIVRGFGATGVLSATAGVRLGSIVGVISELSIAHDPFLDSAGPQLAVALYYAGD